MDINFEEDPLAGNDEQLDYGQEDDNVQVTNPEKKAIVNK